VRKARYITGLFVLLAALAVMPAKAQAATLTIVDTYGGFNTTWTLEVQTGCVVCDVTLKGFFEDPDGAGASVNPYTGQYIDSVQFKIGGADPTAISLMTTNAGAIGDWDFDIDESLNANGCGGGGNNAVCGEWISGGVANGFGPIANDSTLEWTFDATFTEELPAALAAGNIRAAFNKANGKNFNIFSPGGGTFDDGDDDGGDDDGGGVPEPGTLALFGAGLAAAGARMRKRAVAVR
jgi:hypothetical protein